MSDEALRRACEEYAERKGELVVKRMSPERLLLTYNFTIPTLIELCKQQRTAGLLEVQAHIAEQINADIDCSPQTISVYCEQRAKELKP